MLDDLITSNRDVIIARAKARLTSRTPAKSGDRELTNGIPTFVDQLADALRRARSVDPIDHKEISKTAGRHGRNLLRVGLPIAQVVHAYGDVCQTVTELAIQQEAQISADEFRTLNLCIDDAIAGAVTEYARQRERAIAKLGTERVGVLAHEMRNLLNTAMLSFEMIKGGTVAAGGSTGLMHGRSLMRLRDLVDRSLVDVRLDIGLDHLERIPVAEFVEEVEIDAAIEARERGLHLAVTSIDREVTMEGDRQILAAALANLLQNAFKFTRKHSKVSLTTCATADRVLFEVEDECGGLPPGKAKELFRPFEQRGADRSGVGLGLSICLKAARANGGEVRVRDLPGKGCIFTLDLPRAAAPTQPPAAP